MYDPTGYSHVSPYEMLQPPSPKPNLVVQPQHEAPVGTLMNVFSAADPLGSVSVDDNDNGSFPPDKDVMKTVQTPPTEISAQEKRILDEIVSENPTLKSLKRSLLDSISAGLKETPPRPRAEDSQAAQPGTPPHEDKPTAAVSRASLREEIDALTAIQAALQSHPGSGDLESGEADSGAPAIRSFQPRQGSQKVFGSIEGE